MARTDGFWTARALLVFCGVVACILFAIAQYPGKQLSIVSGPDDLLSELEWAQLTAPPSTNSLSYDAGILAYAPDLSDPDSVLFATGLLSEYGGGDGPVRSVTVFEDPFTHDTVFLNAAGVEIFRVPSLPEYNPGWGVLTTR